MILELTLSAILQRTTMLPPSLQAIHPHPHPHSPNPTFNTHTHTHTTVCTHLRKGGHTREMLLLLDLVNRDQIESITYVIASTDTTSPTKVTTYEESLKESKLYDIRFIPRSREVHQSYFTSVFTTLWSLLVCLWLVWCVNPDVVISNGPGTCIPILYSAWFCKVSDSTVVLFFYAYCFNSYCAWKGWALYLLKASVEWPRSPSLPRLRIQYHLYSWCNGPHFSVKNLELSSITCLLGDDWSNASLFWIHQPPYPPLPPCHLPVLMIVSQVLSVSQFFNFSNSVASCVVVFTKYIKKYEIEGNANVRVCAVCCVLCFHRQHCFQFAQLPQTIFLLFLSCRTVPGSTGLHLSLSLSLSHIISDVIPTSSSLSPAIVLLFARC